MSSETIVHKSHLSKAPSCCAPGKVLVGDCLDVMRSLPDQSVDLVLGSPPYEAARTYGIGFNLRGQDWVDWMLPRIAEMRRVCKGLVVLVVEGQTRHYRYSAAPLLLMADLHRAGYHLRKPPIYYRLGIPRNGGPDFLRNDYEFCICVAPPGRLPWSDPAALGTPPIGETPGTRRATTKRVCSGAMKRGTYCTPKLVNPGNVIRCLNAGKSDTPLRKRNEAPYPERLCELFIRSFCPPGGVVLDPFSGSGTTAAVAKRHGRRFVAIDVRESQTQLTQERLAAVGGCDAV